MTPDDLVRRIKARRFNFVNFRWLLFIWLGAVIWYRTQHDIPVDLKNSLLLGAVLLSQAVLLIMPLKYFEGLRFFYAIFLLDLNFILLSFWFTDQMQMDLVMTLFLGIFVAALAKDVVTSVLAFVVISIFYVTLKARTPDGFDFSQTGSLLKLPFLFIASIHSGLVAHEAADELEVKNLLHSERQILAGKIKGTFVETVKFTHDIKLMFDALPFALVMIDLEGKVTVFNHMAEFTFGLPRVNVLGTRLHEHPVLAEFESGASLDKSGKMVEFQLIDIPSAEGQPWQMNMSTYPVRGEKDSALGTLVLLTPISFNQQIKGAESAAVS